MVACFMSVNSDNGGRRGTIERKILFKINVIPGGSRLVGTETVVCRKRFWPIQRSINKKEW